MSYHLPFPLWGLSSMSGAKHSPTRQSASQCRESREYNTPVRGNKRAVLVAVFSSRFQVPPTWADKGLNTRHHKEAAMCSQRRRAYPIQPGELPPELSQHQVEALMAPGLLLNHHRRQALGTLVHDAHDLAQRCRCACQRDQLEQLIQAAEAHHRHQQVEFDLADRALRRLRFVRLAVVGVAHA